MAPLLLAMGCASRRAGVLEGFSDPAVDAVDQPPFAATPRERVAFWLSRAAEGDANSMRAALQESEWLVDASPTRLHRAYLATAQLIAARQDAMVGWLAQLNAARSAVAALNDAVAAAPDDAEVRYLRACALFPLPPFLGYRELAAEDLVWLRDRLDRAPPFIDARRAAFVQLLTAIELAEREGADSATSRAWLEAAARTAPDTAPGRRARAALDGSAPLR